MEKALHDYLMKRYGGWESAKVIEDNGKSVLIKIDFGDDEVITIGINRRKGDNGNYRVYTEC